MKMRTCLLTLPFPPASAPVWLTELGALLAARGLSLVVVTVVPSWFPTLRTVELPFFLADLPTFLPELAPEDVGSALPAIVDCDTAWLALGNRSPEPEASATGAGVCLAFARALISEHRPALALLWHSSTPQSRLFRAAFDEHGIPVLFLEQGFLPGTLMLDVGGMAGDTELTRSFVAADAAPSPQAVDRYHRLRAHVQSVHETRREQAPYREPRAFRAERLDGRSYLVAFLGQCDVAAGLWPGVNDRRAIHSPGFTSTEEALIAVAEAAEARGDCRVIFKPHPTQPARSTLPEGVSLAGAVHIHTLIEAADVVVGQSTTALLDAVVLERPVILLARSALSGRGPIEALQYEDVPAALTTALGGSEVHATIGRSRRFLAWLCDRYLVKTDTLLPAARDLREMADHLAAVALPGAAILSPVPAAAAPALMTQGEHRAAVAALEEEVARLSAALAHAEAELFTRTNER